MKIKGFDKDLKCRGFQFEIGKVYDTGAKDEDLELCSGTVFHYCDSLQKVHSFYDCNDKENRYCEIEVLGKEITDGEKYGSNKIKIIREIKGEELRQLKGLINGNTGVFNTGNRNTGSCNTGNRNTGDWNTGNRNTGSCNTGDWNTGNCNTGSCNTGDWNTGYCNTGNRNTGDRNTGDYNTGNRNAGDWNKCDYSNGFFNTLEDKDIMIFNKRSCLSASQFINSKYYGALTSVPLILTQWIEYTEEEKKQSKEKEMIGGYLKEYSYKEACADWWERMSEGNKEIIKSIPNFNAKIFKEITGIEV
jgi:hypothetical protein